jgi:hypothetical protein
LIYELKAKFPARRQVLIPFGMKISLSITATVDLLVGDRVVVELKAVEPSSRYIGTVLAISLGGLSWVPVEFQCRACATVLRMVNGL